jgi:hypothetical protein
MFSSSTLSKTWTTTISTTFKYSNMLVHKTHEVSIVFQSQINEFTIQKSFIVITTFASIVILNMHAWWSKSKEHNTSSFNLLNPKSLINQSTKSNINLLQWPCV